MATTKLQTLKNLARDGTFLNLPEVSQAHLLKLLLLSERERAASPAALARLIHAQSTPDWYAIDPWLIGERADSVKEAIRLVDAVLAEGKAQPPDRGPQIGRAKQMLRKQPMEYWLAALMGMRRLYRWRDEPFDVFDLARWAGKAIATEEEQAEEEDHRPEWARGLAWTR